MDLSDYLRILRAHWLGVVAITALGAAIALTWTATQPKVYAANANGFVSAGPSSDPAMAQLGDTLAKSRAKSYVDIATSRATAQIVIDDLGLTSSPSTLISNISVDQPLDTVILKITARASTPAKAQTLADAWVSAVSDRVSEIEGSSDQGLRLIPVESAELPTAPVSPRPLFNLLIGLGVGLLAGLAYALIRSQLDRRLRSSADVERRFGVSVVGSIPANRRLDRDGGRAVIAVNEQVDGHGSDAAEAFRKLRTNLAFMDVDNPPRVMVVTSPHQSDGKSTVAINVAAAIATSGQSVTVVDADLRRPTLAESVGLVEGAGLTDILIGRADADDVLQTHPDFAGLQLLAAGGIPPNPSELLGSRTMRTLLDKLSSDGMVILDAPPLLPVTDAAVLTRLCDGALVVISHGKTLDNELSDALNNLVAVQGRVLGVIFNRVPRRNSAGGYYGNYYRSSESRAQAAGASPIEPHRPDKA